MLATLVLAIGTASAAVVVADASPAVGAEIPPTVNYLVLATEPSVLQFPRLQPGDVVYGQVRMSLENATTGALSVTMRKSGALASHVNGMVLSARLCDSEFTGVPTDPASTALPLCALNERTVVVTSPGETYSADAPVWDLAELHSSADRFLLITLRMPPATGPPDVTLQNLTGDFAFQVRVQAPSALPDDDSDPLAKTGANILTALAVAGGALLLGTLLRTGRRRHESAGMPNG